MLVSRQRFLEDLDPNDVHFNIAEMVIAVEARIDLSHAKKEYSFNAFITDDDNIAEFLNNIRYNLPHFINHTRFEVIHMHGTHWTTMDIEINNGNIHVFLFDPAGASVIPNFISLLTTYPNIIITYSSGSIQNSEKGCGTFAYDAAFQLSKITHLHQKLAQFRKYPSEAFKEKLMYLPLSELDSEFGILLRNAQSFTTINTLKKYHPDLIGNKSLFLSDYLEQKNRTKQLTKPPYKPINISFEVKQYAIKLKMKKFVEKISDDEFSSIMENAINFKHLRSYLGNKNKLQATAKPALYLYDKKFQKEFIVYVELETAAYFHGISFAEMRQKIATTHLNMETLYEVIGIFDDTFKKMSLPFLQLCQLNNELKKELQSDPISISGINDKTILLISSSPSIQTATKLFIRLSKIPLEEFNSLGNNKEIKQLLNLSNMMLCKELCEKHKIPFNKILNLSYEKREIIFAYEDKVKILLNIDAWQDLFSLSEQDLFDRLNDPVLTTIKINPKR